ncbi:MAG TPA: hypothetical protein VGB98_04425 [Pyrinomonadaceae bacterium]
MLKISLSARRLAVVLSLLLLTSGVVLATAVASPLPAAPPVTAAVKPLLKVEISGDVERGGAVVSLSDLPSGVRPREVVTWHMRVSNVGDAATGAGTHVDGELSAATVYVPGSASGNGSPAVSFSVDGGKTFSASPVVRYVEAGVEKVRPAPLEAYTHIRFTWPNGFNPGDVRAVEYKARVR